MACGGEKGGPLSASTPLQSELSTFCMHFGLRSALVKIPHRSARFAVRVVLCFRGRSIANDVSGWPLGVDTAPQTNKPGATRNKGGKQRTFVRSTALQEFEKAQWELSMKWSANQVQEDLQQATACLLAVPVVLESSAPNHQQQRFSKQLLALKQEFCMSH